MQLAHSIIVSDLVDGGYSQRKQQRKEKFDKTNGVKKVTCSACSGSGYYDNSGGYNCSSCSGTGKTF